MFLCEQAIARRRNRPACNLLRTSRRDHFLTSAKILLIGAAIIRLFSQLARAQPGTIANGPSHHPTVAARSILLPRLRGGVSRRRPTFGHKLRPRLLGRSRVGARCRDWSVRTLLAGSARYRHVRSPLFGNRWRTQILAMMGGRCESNRDAGGRPRWRPRSAGAQSPDGRPITYTSPQQKSLVPSTGKTARRRGEKRGLACGFAATVGRPPFCTPCARAASAPHFGFVTEGRLASTPAPQSSMPLAKRLPAQYARRDVPRSPM